MNKTITVVAPFSNFHLGQFFELTKRRTEPSCGGFLSMQHLKGLFIRLTTNLSVNRKFINGYKTHKHNDMRKTTTTVSCCKISEYKCIAQRHKHREAFVRKAICFLCITSCDSPVNFIKKHSTNKLRHMKEKMTCLESFKSIKGIKITSSTFEDLRFPVMLPE